MANVIVVTILAAVAVSPMAYLGIMASALKSSDSTDLELSGAK